MKKKYKIRKQKKSRTGFILALIALIILVINILLIFTSYKWIEAKLKEANYPLPENFSQLLTIYGFLWIISAIITFMLIFFYEKRKIKEWWLMLVLGIIVFFTSRIETAILLIIASFFYKKNLKNLK